MVKSEGEETSRASAPQCSEISQHRPSLEVDALIAHGEDLERVSYNCAEGCEQQTLGVDSFRVENAIGDHEDSRYVSECGCHDLRHEASEQIRETAVVEPLQLRKQLKLSRLAADERPYFFPFLE